MNRSISPLLLLLACLGPACAPTPDQYTDLKTRSVDAQGTQSILIQVDYGEVILQASDDSHVKVNGQVLYADELEYLVTTAEKQVTVKVLAHRDNLSRVPLHVIIRLPRQMQVKVETGDASVLVQGYQGDMEIASTSGDVTLEQMTGGMTLRSNRGNITVRESSGQVGVVGNYGLLSIQNTSGEIAASTIMGNIAFGGLIQPGDAVRLETDHGAVSVNLSADSALTLQVHSTSGDVTCLLPEISSSTRTCDGEMHAGGGSLSIRTVSGAVTVQLLP